MQAALVMTAWLVSVVPSHQHGANSLPDIKNEDFIKDCVRIHNKFRSEVTPTASAMLYMTWDPALALIAKAWARNCKFAHNGQLHSNRLHPNFSSVGENIWTGSVSLFSASSAITSWHSEVQDYDFETHRCTKVCGHYTQVVWADSYKVGCAVQHCHTVDGFRHLTNLAHFICNYGPGQSYQRPYRKGSTCSACPSADKCLDNLCTNLKRDKVTDNHSIVHPDLPVSSRNRYLSLFLVVSPPILILSAILTLWVKHKYPHLVLLN
ncbi:glioma pathogenesis-related protein 1 [Meles meles]|uniref:glioma pathogenesis-related protein 1 n=1 Tax=Meles meles TaxID=9662 RepID=UPI001E69A6AE|nr:glioma pathogenesis-related protein 1 [Meles meles]